MTEQKKQLTKKVIAASVAVSLSCIVSTIALAKDSQQVADIKASIVGLTAMIALNPRQPIHYYERALLYKKVRAYGAAADDLRMVQKLKYPHYRFSLFSIRGLCDYKAGNYYKAVEDYNYALAMKPKSDYCYANRAAAFLALKRYKLALNDCHQAIKLNSHVDAPFSTAGECYYRIGQYQHAITYLNKAIARNTNNSHAFYFRGASYLKLGKKLNGDLDLMKAKKLGYKAKNSARRS